MEEKLNGIVLSGVNFGESDKILTIFTLEKGVVSAKIKGVKKAGAKLKFASEPFCFAEFIFSTTGGKRIVIGATLIESFYDVRQNLFKFYSGATVLEFVRRFEKEDIVSPELFKTVIDSLKQITYGEKSAPYYLVDFLLKGLKKVGYGLNLGGCFNCGGEIANKVFFEYNVGGFYCENCFNGVGREINLDTYFGLNEVALGQDADEDKIKKCLRLINYYVDNKTEEKINSLSELIKILN